jgi:Dihydrouridine synthase (Dus)
MEWTLHAARVSTTSTVFRIPLTNLPTVGLATSFLAGSKEEWSLVRRHPSESIFGVQLAGSKPATMVPAAEVIAKECTGNVDFVDINCGCPIDLVFRTGSGSARMLVLILLSSHLIRSLLQCLMRRPNSAR